MAEILSPRPEPNPTGKSTQQGPILSRRGFLRLAGATATGFALAALAQDGAQGSTATQEIEPAASGFGNLPIVEGEVLDLNPYINKTLLRFIEDINVRDQPEATGRARKTPIGSVLRVDTRDVEGRNGDPNTWAGGEIVDDGKNIIPKAIAENPNDATINDWVATNIEGRTVFITDPNEVPDRLKPTYVTEPKGLPVAFTEYPIDSLVELFSRGVGGEETLAEAWNKPIKEGKPIFDESPLDAWQRAITMTAFYGLDAEEQSTQNINICSLVGGTSVCNFYRRVDKTTGDIDIICRFLNPQDKKRPEIFTITRFSNDEAGIKVKGVGFVTPEGLGTMYGQEAEDMAGAITAVAGKGTSELAGEINKLLKTKVCLPSLESENQFAPKIPPPSQEEKVQLISTGTTPADDWRYYREGNNYFAALDGQEADGEEVVVEKRLYLPNVAQGGEWLELPDSAILKANINVFASSLGVDAKAVEDNIRFSSITDKHGSVLAIALYGNVPLLIGNINSGENIKWETATIGKMADIKGKMTRLAGNVHMISRYINAIKDFNGYSLPDGHWEDPNYSVAFRPSSDRFNFSVYDKELKRLKAEGIEDIQFYHIIWGLQYALPAWLINGDFTSQEYRTLATDHIKEVMEHYAGQINKYVVVNEAWGNPWDTKSRFWQDKLGDPSQWVLEMFRTAYQTDPNAKLILNDFGIEIPGTRWWNGEKEPKFFRIVKQIHDEGMPVEAGFQLHLHLSDFSDPTKFKQLIENYRTQLKKYISAGIKVNITEFDLSPEGVDLNMQPELKAKITKSILEASFEEGVEDFTFFGTPGEKNQPMFDSFQNPTPSYFAANTAIYNS
ncbi:hypothetical protein A3A93_05895 [Candidatus Roizmanbacteria bacterium RIFCSPLOWO2_01_FULL_38_12]|uniref:endo-1,4-beta-xylanase n=1 Tax=Candidatus Roizmanbacteria bacterium RIFCSPLOWO2_01_FULL_38_12 TaxID=1802061 RepID=A0A1F7IV96_9BACT|nr:MAG: hypothetical protein A3F59_00035 [Candidatus Roizmanbacteria bacterium RIFCSPHIGHO2_12_FULL_38_13]OGK47291.1 MAG: hypothetical protein A3A93_05895 [Candidatus Roizmanbacteria bacterium RIFCSPLOWO2_01_FULL_38_12]